MLSSIIAKNARLIIFLSLAIVLGMLVRAGQPQAPMTPQNGNAAEASLPDPSTLPRIVVSLAPVHSLVAGIMDGIGTPELLFTQEANHHQFSLRPSDVERLTSADLVIVTSQQTETYLKAALEQDDDKKTLVLELLTIPGLTLYPSTDPDDDPDPKESPQALPDMHVWLDPLNAVAMVQYLTEKLTELMPQYAEKLMANAQQLTADLNALQIEIESAFKPFGAEKRTAAYMTYHNMLRYYEGRYHLVGGLALTSHPESSLKPEDVNEAEAAASSHQLKCVLTEKQFSAKPLANLAEKHQLKIEPIDALGAGHETGKTLYFDLLRDITRTITGCMVDPKTQDNKEATTHGAQ